MNRFACFGQPVLSSVAWILLCISLRVAVVAAEPHTAKVVNLTGSARYMPPGSNWCSLSAGQQLGPGSVIQTDLKPSCVEIALARERKAGSSVVVLTNSVLRIHTLSSRRSGDSEVAQTGFDLKVGRILGKLDRSSEHSLHIDAGNQTFVMAPYEKSTNLDQAVYVFDVSGRLLVLSGELTVQTWQSNGTMVKQVVPAGHQLASTEITKLEADAPERKLWR